MHIYELANDQSINDLISTANNANEPVVVSCDGSECLVAMHPAIFERVLFGTTVLNCSDRMAMRF